MDKLKTKVVALLRSHPHGLTISDLVRKTNVGSRATLLMRITELRAEKKIREQKVGTATLVTLNGRKR